VSATAPTLKLNPTVVELYLSEVASNSTTPEEEITCLSKICRPPLFVECLNNKSAAVLMFLTQDIFLSIYYLTFGLYYIN
jgi:hypothetical protein